MTRMTLYDGQLDPLTDLNDPLESQNDPMMASLPIRKAMDDPLKGLNGSLNEMN